ncbi:hypothetical protein P3S68_010317 [Capsicum galapagoense]
MKSPTPKNIKVHQQNSGHDSNNALEQSLHKSIPRVGTGYFISIYEEEEFKNDGLLRFAKLDFNLLQMLHKQELSEVSRWWKDLDFVTTLPYARDRTVECYFWTVGVYAEPQYSQARVMLAKTIAMISIVDDTFDAYGIVKELDVYRDAIQRWEIFHIDRLPDYMKICYKALLDHYNYYQMGLSKDGRSDVVHYAKERMKEIVRNYFVEAKWFIEGLYAACMKCATKEDFEWLMTLCRVIDDIATYEVEKGRGQIATGIECYMRDYGVSTEEAMEKFQEMADTAWKDVNERILRPTAVSTKILTHILNLARIIDVTY